MLDRAFGEGLRLESLYRDSLGRGRYPTSEVTPEAFPEPAPTTLLLYLADIAGMASQGEKLRSLETVRRRQFKEIVAQSFAEKWPLISQQITPEETPELHRLMNGTEEARVLIKTILGD
jgi:hypothetical protein